MSPGDTKKQNRSISCYVSFGRSTMSSKEANSKSAKPDLYIVARLIKVLKERGKTTRTTLATVSGLPYDRLVKYLVWMVERGLVKIDDDELVYLTEKGRETYDRLVDWIMEYVGKLKFPRLKGQ